MNGDMPAVVLRDGSTMPALGQGTWRMGTGEAPHVQEIAALRAGVEAGLTLVDTAEMYGEGAAERLVGEALLGTAGEAPAARENLYIVSKVYPWHAGRTDIIEACRATLERLGTSYLDLYLLHWRGEVPLAQTVAGMEELAARGMIRRWGVSNFDIADMEDLWAVPGGDRCMVNQVLYHAASRGIEFSLLPWMERHGVACMAYCPLAMAGELRRGLFGDPAVLEVARRHDATPAQALLAFLMRGGRVAAIPKAASAAHARENARAATLRLDAYDLALFDRAFPPPEEKMPLDMQ